MRIELPYPPSILSPNSREHWRPKSVAVKKYRHDCKCLALGKQPFLTMKITFHPPCGRRRDIDNAIGAFKSGQDGLAEAWGVDDSQFEVLYARKFGEIVKGGKVVIEAI